MNPIKIIMNEIIPVMEEIDETVLEEAVNQLNAGKRIFVFGEGRSGFMGRSFAMRLMHLGAEVYFIGETICPAIKENDVVVLISGSGKSKQVNQIAHQAKALNNKVIAITASEESELGLLATLRIVLPTGTKFDKGSVHSSVQPLSSLFDQCTHIVVDAICLAIKQSQAIDEKDLFSRHTNV